MLSNFSPVNRVTALSVFGYHGYIYLWTVTQCWNFGSDWPVFAVIPFDPVVLKSRSRGFYPWKAGSRSVIVPLGPETSHVWYGINLGILCPMREELLGGQWGFLIHGPTEPFLAAFCLDGAPEAIYAHYQEIFVEGRFRDFTAARKTRENFLLAKNRWFTVKRDYISPCMFPVR